MNRYPAWKYAILLVALLVALVYTLPNLFGEAPAVQVSSSKSAVKVDSTTVTRVEEALKAAGLKPDAIALDGSSVKARFGDTDTQLKAKDVIQKALSSATGDSAYVVALNLLSRSPAWLTQISRRARSGRRSIPLRREAPRSDPENSTSTMRSTPLAPITTGTPT